MNVDGMRCYVAICDSSYRDLEKWGNKVCDAHGMLHSACSCDPPYRFFPFPDEREQFSAHLSWIIRCQSIQDGSYREPSETQQICSRHFVDGEPTAAHPDPELNITARETPGSDSRSRPETRLVKQRTNLKVDMVDSFDPDRSRREMRKIYNRISLRKKQLNVYNDEGVHMATGLDICDCLEVLCPGCHTVCGKCSSRKCGVECRCLRRWRYEQVEIEGVTTYGWPDVSKSNNSDDSNGS